MKNISKIALSFLLSSVPVLSQTSETIKITKKEAVIINTVFDNNRRLRELSMLKDSLINDLRMSGLEKSQIITKQSIQIKKYNSILAEKDSIESNYVSIIKEHEQNIAGLEKSIKREKRKKNFWKYSGIVAIVASSFIILTK